MPALLLALLAQLLVPASAAAHQKSVSYSKWTLVEGGAIAEVRVRWLELTALPAIAEAVDREGDPFDLSLVLPYLEERLSLHTETGVCEVNPASAVRLPAEQGWLRVEWRVHCDGAPTRLESQLFSSLTNHVHFATILGPEAGRRRALAHFAERIAESRRPGREQRRHWQLSSSRRRAHPERLGPPRVSAAVDRRCG